MSAHKGNNTETGKTDPPTWIDEGGGGVQQSRGKGE